MYLYISTRSVKVLPKDKLSISIGSLHSLRHLLCTFSKFSVSVFNQGFFSCVCKFLPLAQKRGNISDFKLFVLEVLPFLVEGGVGSAL